MTDNNKFIPKIPETKTEIVLNQTQQEQSEQKPITEKVKEAVVPTVHASDSKKDKGKEDSYDGRGSPKIVQADNKWARDAAKDEWEKEKRNAIEESPCDIQ